MKKRIYLDNAAATPVSAEALKVMVATAKRFPANPSAIHREGKSARACLEQARGQIAGALSAHADEIVFTSGATEANNLAITGVLRVCGIARPRIIVSAIEHASVIELAESADSRLGRRLNGAGLQVDYLPVDSRGLVDPRELRKLITPETALVSVMYANNEIGTIEPIHDIAKEIRHARKVNGSAYPYLHTDAGQAGNYLDINVARLGVDIMTLSSGKVYGPRGIGALFVKRGVNLLSQMYGGEHEGGRRPGTESPALVVGFAEALLEARKMSEKESKRVQKLRDLLAEKILKTVSGTSVNGGLECFELSRHCEARSNPEHIDCHVGVPPRDDGKQGLVIYNEHSLPNILNLSFDGIESDALVLSLDAAGIAVSGKSACKSAETGASHVIMALGKGGNREMGAIRFSLGRETKREDIVRTAKEVARIVPLLREAYAQSDRV